ncbi:hypothetical protein [Bartonella rattimassiliensis]|uniref:Uncharacterized protein n=1 Tax=Bartonella rattimassiliensis 15908 TaxID=1094556 RepID=J0QMN3_9HYPH|nr:hypothetical protein [Bartonella rattimassiliensis]EJF86911.1 hypothetical protein MCY_00561 [Bartonella rattimassiliensis 15908]
MTIKYLFAICAILLIFLSVVKASECPVYQKEAYFTSIPTISSSNLFISKESYYLLNKVILPAHPGNHTILWKNIVFLFQKAKRVYTNLGIYLYYSIFSIFK